MSLARHIPNALTCANLLCGCLGIISIIKNYPVEPAYFVWIACIFDFFDGFVARLLKVTSPIGKELDSLADMVSFGVLPSLVMFQWIDSASEISTISYVGLSIAVFSALRLAKFNIDTRQSDSFIGLPTPANSLFITALPFLPDLLRPTIFATGSLVIITIVFSFLLVAPINLFALKFKNYSFPDNKIRYLFLGLSIILLIFFKAGALPFIIISYIILSLTGSLLSVKKN
ncbi:MAG: CDP-diacylglycerol--serine O-phosphatidyltransferase [Cyclobacteriaceae bacterium]|nr:CDP-diacylglycerol--serine O-phosphatidyltransferase [Cyclobacteriaceae bacterium]